MSGGLGCGAKHYKVRLPGYIDSRGPQQGLDLEIHYVHAKAASGNCFPLLVGTRVGSSSTGFLRL